MLLSKPFFMLTWTFSTHKTTVTQNDRQLVFNHLQRKWKYILKKKLVSVDHYTASRENVKTKVILCETQFSYAHKLLVRILKGLSNWYNSKWEMHRVLQVESYKGRVEGTTTLDLLAIFLVLQPITWLIFLISLSLLRILKSISAKIEPWGTSLVTSLHLDTEPLTTILWLHPFIRPIQYPLNSLPFRSMLF